jgi:hypothetical protein
MYRTFWPENYEERDYLGDIPVGVDGRIILKWMLEN